MTTESGSQSRSHEPSNILRGTPVSVASSTPRQKVVANLPAAVRATGLPLKSLTAHCTPSTPRTRLRSVSLSALVCSKYSGEDGSLVFQQEGGEGDGKDEGEILGAISGEHFKGDEIHIFE